MIHRIVLITVVQLGLYAALIPMHIAYQMTCQQRGAACGDTAAPSAAQSQRSLALSIAQPPR